MSEQPWHLGDKAIFLPRNEAVTVLRQLRCEDGWGNTIVADADGDEHEVNNWQLRRPA